MPTENIPAKRLSIPCLLLADDTLFSPIHNLRGLGVRGRDTKNPRHSGAPPARPQTSILRMTLQNSSVAYHNDQEANRGLRLRCLGLIPNFVRRIPLFLMKAPASRGKNEGPCGFRTLNLMSRRQMPVPKRLRLLTAAPY